jgi:hypothetical protein
VEGPRDEPSLLVLDEPTSALDMLARRGILDLISALRRDLGLTCLFISDEFECRPSGLRPHRGDVPGTCGGRWPSGSSAPVPSIPLHARP